MICPNWGVNILILDSAMANPIIVLDYDPNWPGLFQSLRKRIADTLGDMAAAIERLASLGYIHRGDLGIPEREAFPAPAHDPPQHLYVCPPWSAEFGRHMAFRDYLRAHPKEAKIYGA